MTAFHAWFMFLCHLAPLLDVLYTIWNTKCYFKVSPPPTRVHHFDWWSGSTFHYSSMMDLSLLKVHWNRYCIFLEETPVVDGLGCYGYQEPQVLGVSGCFFPGLHNPFLGLEWSLHSWDHDDHRQWSREIRWTSFSCLTLAPWVVCWWWRKRYFVFPNVKLGKHSRVWIRSSFHL